MKKRTTVLNAWLLFFIMLIILYTMSLFLLSQYTRKVLYKNFSNSTELAINRICADVDDFFSASDNIYTAITTLDKTKQLLNTPSNNMESNYLKYEYQKDLRNFYFLQKNYKYMLWIENSNTIVTPDAVLDSELFYKYFFAAYYSSYEEFRDNLLNRDSLVFSIPIANNNSGNLLIYTRNVIYPTVSNNKIHFISYIDTGSLTNFQNFVDSGNRYMLFVRRKGDLLFSDGNINDSDIKGIDIDNLKDTVHISHDKYIVISSESDSGNISIKYLINHDAYAEQIRKYNIIIVTTYILLLFLNIYITYIFVKKSYNPIKKLFHLFEIQNNESENEFETIGNKYLEYKNMYSNTIDRLKHSHSIAQHYIICHLLSDGFIQKDDLQILFGEYDPYLYNYIILISTKNTDLLSKIRSKFEAIVNDYNGTNALRLNGTIQNDSIIYIVNTATDNTSVLDDSLRSVCEFYDISYGANIYIGISKPCDNFFELPQKHIEAQKALKYSYNTNEYITHFDNTLSVPKNSFFYPIDIEHALLEELINRRFKKAKTIIEKVYEVNFNERQLSEETINTLFNNIIATFNKYVDTMPTTSSFHYSNNIISEKSISELKDVEAKKKHILHLLLRFDEILTVEELEKDITLIKSVKNYININYTDSNINVSSIAMHFEVRQDYLSRVFKQKEGIGLLEYLNKTRIDEAARLLRSTDASISDIAKCVGFFNYRTFARQFIKQHNISPQSYRENQ